MSSFQPGRLVTVIIFSWVIALDFCHASADTSKAYIPPEFQAADPEVKTFLESADKSAEQGRYLERTQLLQKALQRCTSNGLLADKAIVEDRLAAAYFLEGQFDDAKQQWINALADGSNSNNLALQADVLVAIASFSQTTGNLDEALKTAMRASDLAAKSKDHYIQARALGELARLQLTMGRTAEARASIEEALQIDRANQYDWEANHLLYQAWIMGAESEANIDKAIDIATSARDLALTKNNYIVFIQASTTLTHAYIHKGQVSTGLQLLQLAQDGKTTTGASFSRPVAFQAAVSLPFLKIVLLEELATAYEAAQQSDDALSTWQKLLIAANTAGFTLAKGEAAHAIAKIYRSKRTYDQAISYYAIAAESWAAAGNVQRRIEALSWEASMLFQVGQKSKAVAVDDVVLPLARSSKNIRLQFITDLAIAEALDGSDELSRLQTALTDAESLINPDLTVPGVEANFLVELFVRLAALHAREKDLKQELIALEKGLTPALALATAPEDKKNPKPLAWFVQELQTKIASEKVKELADAAYDANDLKEALIFLELQQYFDEYDAAWKGKYSDYEKNLNIDPTFAKLAKLPQQIISTDDGANVLASNINEMGPLAGRVRLSILGLLTSYYMLQQKPDLIVKFATEALPYLKLGPTDTPSPFDVAMVCELAYASMLTKDLDAAMKALGPCMAGAKKVGNPELLRQAHQTNAAVLEAAGKHVEAQESVQLLVGQKPDDPLIYVQLALLKAQDRDSVSAAAAWKKAIELYERTDNLRSAADAHLNLANLLGTGKATNPDEQREHLERAESLFRQIGSDEGLIKAEAGLGSYYTARADPAKAQQYFGSALKRSRAVKRRDLEAAVLSQIGQSYQSSADFGTAARYYKQSAEIYADLKDSGNEAFQQLNTARVLYSSHKSEEALSSLLRAKALADESKSWSPQYWVRRSLADLYQTEGAYQNALEALQQAKEISESAKQQLPAAWAALAIAGVLEVMGEWQDAAEQVTLALPTVQAFDDQDDEFSANVELISIYGARDSDIRDLDKATKYYDTAYQRFGKARPDRAAALDLAITETYWAQGRFKDAVAKARAALDYYRERKDELGEANSLISLAEAQYSEGDIESARKNLEAAQPGVSAANNFYVTGRYCYAQAGLLKREQHYKEAIQQYERVIDMLEQFKASSDPASRRSVSENYSFIYEELLDAYYLLGSTDQQLKLTTAQAALDYAELNKARSFAMSWGVAFTEGLTAQVPAALRDRERGVLTREVTLESQLNESLSRGGSSSSADIKRALASVKEEKSRLVQELRKINPVYAQARYPEPIKLTGLPIRSGELLVEFKMLPDGVLVWLIGNSGSGAGGLIAFYKVNKPREWFEARIFRIRDAFNTDHPDDFDPSLSEELFNALFPEPFANELRASQSVVFIPDDVLFLLPLEMLSPTASKGKYILSATATDYFPSAAAFRLSRGAIRGRPSWQEQFLGVADPITSPDDPRYPAANSVSTLVAAKGHDDQQQPSASRAGAIDATRLRSLNLPRLPGTATEVKGIAALFSETVGQTQVRTGLDATKRELMQTDLSRFRFVHFATHGILPVEASIKEPALVLSYDGSGQQNMLLTISDVFQLKLHADMVVLSACNTGSGKVTRAEGVASLGTAFLAAGSSSAAVSLWHVADNSTAILMQEFYRNILRGASKPEALASARSKLISLGYSNPFFWAPFVLTGE